MVDGERRITYAQLRERVNRLASALRRHGLERHDRVAALCPNVPELLELHHAVPAAGGVLVAINTRLGPQEIGYILEHSGARVLFVDAELEPGRGRRPSGPRGRARWSDGADPYERLLADGDPAGVPSLLLDEEEPIAIDYTSGTTGRPKGVVYTYRGAYLNALGEVIEAELGHHPVYLWTLPMFHCNGWCFPWAVTAAGGTHVCLRRSIRRTSGGLIHERGGHALLRLADRAARARQPPGRRALERRVTALVAAAPPSPTLLARIEALNIHVVHVYGLTETYGPAHGVRVAGRLGGLPVRARAACWRARARATRRPTRSASSTRTCATCPATPRRWARSSCAATTSWRATSPIPRPPSTAFRGGWFHSGDLAVWHPDDAIELRDRGKDVIISGGENISSIEVEQTICAHPAVLECAVVAIPDERWGERPKAFVDARGRRDGRRGGAHRVLPRAPRALQVPRRDRVRPAAEDVDRQGAEVRAPRAGVGRPAAADQLVSRCARRRRWRHRCRRAHGRA